jgi:hypothetical protein
LAGSFDPARFAFLSLDYEEVLSDFEACRARITRHNPNVRFVITVSPAPLTATASGRHVEVATVHSKSVLRAVCGTLFARHDNIDYFPSYEVITSQHAGGAHYDANLRSVATRGVETAMKLFLDAHQDGEVGAAELPVAAPPAFESEADLICEAVFLGRFARTEET